MKYLLMFRLNLFFFLILNFLFRKEYPGRFRSKTHLKEILKHMVNRRTIITRPLEKTKNHIYRLTNLEKKRIQRNKLEKIYPNLKESYININI